jgi:plastocyanin
MMGRGLASCIGILVPLGAAAEGGVVEGTVQVTGRVGSADAAPVIVYVVGFVEPAPNGEEAVVAQHNRHFEPDLVAITAGQSVSFPNRDLIFHNVFSLSSAREFDLGQFPQGRSKSKRFPEPGVVDVYCNIHPEMAATVLVLPNRRFARVGPDGAFRIEAVPAGSWTVFAYSRRSTAPAHAPVEVRAGRATQVNLALEETRVTFSHRNKFGEQYRDGKVYPAPP